MLLFIFSCEKEQEENKATVRFYTTRASVIIHSDFGNFQISQGVKYPPDCSISAEPDEPYKVRSYKLPYGTYKVHYEDVYGTFKGDAEFTVDQDCLKLDCGLILGWR